MTDAQLQLLEQLTYLDERNNGKKTIAEIVNSIPQEEMDAMLRGERIMKDGDIRYPENERERQIAMDRARAYQAIKNDEELMRLEIISRDSYKGMYAFRDPQGEPGQAYVSFKGTMDAYEWVDNVNGLSETDTMDQEHALDFVESLPQEYQHISVVGHSKGGNKAMYVTIRSDRVDNCVSMDGQGFSKEFLEKYQAEIEEKGGQIRNYSLDSDFVNILLWQVPGSHQIYTKNDGRYEGTENHEPTSILMYDENGKPYTPKEGQYPRQEVFNYLSEFTQYADMILDDEDKARVANYLGPALAFMMSGPYYQIEKDGVPYNKDNLKEYLLSDMATLSLILLTLMSYMKINEIGGKKLFQMLVTLVGLDETAAIAITGGFVALSQLDDLRKGSLSFLDNLLGKDVSNMLEGFMIQSFIKYRKKIGMVVGAGINAVKNALGLGPKTYNYSQKVMDAADEAIWQINGACRLNLNWSRFSSRQWYRDSMVSELIRGITNYYDTMVQVNNASIRSIRSVFQNASEIDHRTAMQIQESTERLRNCIQD